MTHVAMKNTLRLHQAPTPGKVVTDSNRFDGHDSRMAAHMRRIWNHACERTDGQLCRDCIYRRKR